MLNEECTVSIRHTGSKIKMTVRIWQPISVRVKHLLYITQEARESLWRLQDRTATW